jgi:hypothetical protein
MTALSQTIVDRTKTDRADWFRSLSGLKAFRMVFFPKRQILLK